MYDRSTATSLTLDELHEALMAATFTTNVTVEIITADDNRLTSETTAIQPGPDHEVASDKDPRAYLMFNSIGYDHPNGEPRHVSEAWFMIPSYYLIERIDRMDGDDEQTIAVDCEYVYYVVLKDGVKIRIEI